jgi:N-acetyl-anhydromuramyl-L-alanine amidase AmpD
MHSNLVNGVYIAHSGNYQRGRAGQKVSKITIHQMAGKLTAKQCAVNIFGKKGRKASANYCIGYNGDIVCNVEEENRAYTSSSAWNDNRAITIEVSNSANGSDRITEASWNSLLNLCTDICRRYGFKLVYDNTRNGSLTRHDMYANTSCPRCIYQVKTT